MVDLSLVFRKRYSNTEFVPCIFDHQSWRNEPGVSDVVIQKFWEGFWIFQKIAYLSKFHSFFRLHFIFTHFIMTYVSILKPYFGAGKLFLSILLRVWWHKFCYSKAQITLIWAYFRVRRGRRRNIAAMKKLRDLKFSVRGSLGKYVLKFGHSKFRRCQKLKIIALGHVTVRRRRYIYQPHPLFEVVLRV